MAAVRKPGRGYYDAEGRLRASFALPVRECSALCGCNRNCANRVVAAPRETVFPPLGVPAPAPASSRDKSSIVLNDTRRFPRPDSRPSLGFSASEIVSVVFTAPAFESRGVNAVAMTE